MQILVGRTHRRSILLKIFSYSYFLFVAEEPFVTVSSIPYHKSKGSRMLVSKEHHDEKEEGEEEEEVEEEGGVEEEEEEGEIDEGVGFFRTSYSQITKFHVR